MRPVLLPFTQPATHSNAKVVWPALAQLGSLLALALWLLWPASPLQAQKSSALSQPQTLVPLNGIVQVAAGTHTCALTEAGGVKCWGYNDSGQLGDGTWMDKSTPVDVMGLDSGIATLASGVSHTCALTSVGGVKCWGDNRSGQLGDGTTGFKNTPVDVVGLDTGVIAITTGFEHTCALTSAGSVKCWGWNSNGQVGDGTTTSKNTPVDVVGLGNGIAAIAAGYMHTCALTTGGGVKCWGRNDSGQLGDGTSGSGTDKTTPVGVVGLGNGMTAIAAGGYHTCVLITAGGVKCWGSNGSGQVGDGTTTGRIIPVDVVGLSSSVAAIAAGLSHSCALTSTGGVQCWGWNGTGQLGDGTESSRSNPVDVVGLGTGVIAVATGNRHTCAVTTGSGVKCWGHNGFGQMGDGTTANKFTPVGVVGLDSGVAAIASGDAYTCALGTADGVMCWGNGFGFTPVGVVGLDNGVSAIAAGDFHTCVLSTAGAVRCWGFNLFGQLGDGTTGGTKNTPVDVVGLDSNVTAIAAGWLHTCALTSGGGVKCWGMNNYGQLGDGTTVNKNTPVDVAGLGSGVTAIAAGYTHTCALTSAGGVKCWGNNDSGQLGDSTTGGTKNTPVDVTGLGNGVVAIAAGGINNSSHTCALTSAGGIKCWGANYEGQLGDGTTGNKNMPTDVMGLNSGVIAITAGHAHTCAVTSGGGVKCWGWNYSGQLGDSTTGDKNTPTDVMGLGSGMIAITAGYEHTCALNMSGGVQCWGDNYFGQLGDGTAWRTTPGDVLVDRILSNQLFLPAVQR